MAKRRSRGVNVSAAIREYLDANPDVGPTEAAAEISKKVGKKVSPTYVSNIKSTDSGKGKRKGRRGRKPGRAAARASKNDSFGMGTIEAVTKLVRDVGAKTAKRLIDMMDWRK